MSKKDKKIEIQLEETKITLKGETYPGYVLSIGKKAIGEIAELSENQFGVLKNGSVDVFHKQLEKAVENIIENYNLSH